MMSSERTSEQTLTFKEVAVAREVIPVAAGVVGVGGCHASADNRRPNPLEQRSKEAPASTAVYCHTKDPNLQTRHLVVYNTGPAIGVQLATLKKVFSEYGSVERLDCPNPNWSRVYISYTEVEAAVRARAGRNRPADIEERVRAGIPKAAMASDVFAPKPGEPCPLLGRWLKVAFADRRKQKGSTWLTLTLTRDELGSKTRRSGDDTAPRPHVRVKPSTRRIRAAKDQGGNTTTGMDTLPEALKEFKAFDALAAGGTRSSDSRKTPCPLCARLCGGQRGLRMHLIGAHPAELRDCDHLVHLLKEGSALIPTNNPRDQSSDSIQIPAAVVEAAKEGYESEAIPGLRSTSRVHQAPPVVGGGAAAKGRAGAKLPPGFAAARAGDLAELRRLAEGSASVGGWNAGAAVDRNGSTPLDWAAGEGHLEVCRYLLEACGADPGRKCALKGRGEGRTALHWAARGGHEEVCRLLLDTPRSMKATGTFPTHRDEREHVATAEDIALPTNTNSRAIATNGIMDYPRDSVVSDAALHTTRINDASSCLTKIAVFVDPDVVSAEGTTALHWACWGAHLSTCKLLVSRGADHRLVNVHGCNVAHWCGLAGDVEVCRWLASPVEDGGAGGLDWGKTNRQGHTICHKAALKGHRGLLQWLRQQTVAGIVPESAWGRDEGGYVPRDVARLAGHVELAEWLDLANNEESIF